MFRGNKGITLIALVITIIVLLIITGISIRGGNSSLKTARGNKLFAELDMVQHCCLERYSEYNLTKDSSLLKGTVVTSEEASSIASNDFGRSYNTYWNLL